MGSRTTDYLFVKTVLCRIVKRTTQGKKEMKLVDLKRRKLVMKNEIKVGGKEL